MSTSVIIREISPGVWTFSKPFARFGLFPVGGRSTAIKLKDNAVWVLASTPLTDTTKAKLDELGEVKWIVGPDAVHHLYLGEYKRSYPQAKVIGVEPLVDKKKDEFQFDGVYGQDPADTKYGFESEIDACYFSGFANKDVAFCHRPSKTLVIADLLFNLPAKEQYSKTWSVPIIGNLGLGPLSYMHKQFVWAAGHNKEEMRRDAKTVAGWDFTTIIPCHGDVIEKEGDKAWREAYKWYLDV
ncbi:hypothetical protein M407DRAFT_90077 [Tulasnella calospora MUT 4182]|uniref:Metallo-beta-lactamase domain-containing protein n=1 Tax=Tulasnella calospora MUT 4182 TaxID=1051891 RepID=A0A0C3QZD8_9AGAM|nr:hypothetical protein M407DRAFT_90077 [Tulasnella calospora MUT 4182]